MFTRRTVFIVGAGASREVNFPVGTDLMVNIARKLDIRFDDGWTMSNGDKRISEAVKTIVSATGQRADSNPHYAAGRAISGAMSQAISIDNYLHTHSSDRLVVQMGKLGIAASILEAEASCLLKVDGSKNEAFSFEPIKHTWFSVFFQMLHEGVQREKLEGIFKNVSFITFNYDRCIEHYLAHSISNYYRIPLPEAEGIIAQSLQIEHPYGQVGRLPWQPASTSSMMDFGHDFRGADLPHLAEQIRTFTERVDDDDMMERLHRQIAEAEVVVYLGFSYGEMNMQLMTVKEAGLRTVFGTTLGISAPNKKIIETDVRASMGSLDVVAVNRAYYDDLTCGEFLRSYGKPIMRG